MPSFHCNGLVVLKRNRIRTLTNDEHTVVESSNDQTSPQRIYTKHRRATLFGIPPTLISISEPDLGKNVNVQPTVFFYNEETFQEACYLSAEDIRTIEPNECLWIDVTGVSEKLYLYK
jgi:hypothetical protein